MVATANCQPRKRANKRKPRANRRRKAKSARKCMRPGPMTGNPFLNFMREFRRKHCLQGTIIEALKQGAQEWKKLSCEEKAKYARTAKRKARINRSQAKP